MKSVTVIRMTVARQSLNRAYSVSHQNQRKKHCADISSRALEANKHGCTRKINMRTPCEKNLGRNKESTTGAEDTQNHSC